jgi:hypothetical protein
MKVRLVRLAVLCASLLALATPAAAQVYTGRIDVTVTDTTGAILPGATVDVTGPQNATTVTDGKGEAHFLGLPPGQYTVVAKLDGFNQYKNDNVQVSTGVGVPLKVTLGVGAITASVDVSGGTPVIDPRRTSATTNVTNEELQQIPSARDPWVVLQTVPGIIVDRVNVGGAESGQQSSYQAKGAGSGDNTWSIDGIAITDMAALGSSPTYYDFDMFQEMNVSTGGSDLQTATPGVALNFVLKSGANTPHGSTRIYYEDEDMQSNNLPADLKASLGGVTGKGNRIKAYKDWGGEIGGPLFKDKLWAWGAYGKTDVTLLTLSNTPDQTILKNTSFKGTGQVSQALRGGFTFFRGDKQKFGRNAGPTHPPETTWNQSGPTSVYKGEGNVVVSNNLFLTGRYAYVDGGFQLTPQGGLNTPYYVDDGGIFRGSYIHYETIRPQRTASVDGNFFKGRHEVKFGFGWRKADVDSSSIVPGGIDGHPNHIITNHLGYPNMYADVYIGNQVTSASGKYTNFYAGDTLTWDRLTLNLGLRWDRQSGSVKANTQLGSKLFPTLLPDLTSSARNDVIVHNSLTPRVGVTYALDNARKTLARASYGSFASQLNATAGNFMSTVGGRGVYFYDVVDLNGNRVIDAAELAGRTCSNALAAAGTCNYYGFDITNPSNIASPIHTVGKYRTPLTHELEFGMDHELMPNFGLSGSVIYRTFVNFNWRNNGLVGTDYVASTPLVGTHPSIGDYNAPIFIATRRPSNPAATEYRDRPDYSQRFLGLEVAATKRLSNKWMARFGFSSNDHREYFDSPAAFTDPTPTPASPNKDGGLVVRQSGGSGKSGIFQLLPKYQFIMTGLYQAPWGINLAGNMVNRQGFAMQYNRSQISTADPVTRLKTVFLLDEAGDKRLPSVTSLDLRVGKEFSFRRTKLNLDLDIFNALNTATILGREFNLTRTTGNNVLEIMNPRVVRLGARFGF